jgi:hypothetical protein
MENHNSYGDLYMDNDLWETIGRCEKLLEQVDKLSVAYPGNDEKDISGGKYASRKVYEWVYYNLCGR